MTKTKHFFIGQIVWAKKHLKETSFSPSSSVYWWPVEICNHSEPVEETIPSNCYVFRFAKGNLGFAPRNDIKPFEEMTLSEVLEQFMKEGNHTMKRDQFLYDYEYMNRKYIDNQQDNNKVMIEATTRPNLNVTLLNKTCGLKDYIEVVVGKKKEDSDDEETMKDEDSVCEDDIDSYEMDNILQVYNNEGFLGILEYYGMSMANLKFSMGEIAKNSIAVRIYQENSRMKDNLKECLFEFLTSFSTKYSDGFVYSQTRANFQKLFEEQYVESQRLSEKLHRLSPTQKSEMFLTKTPPLFLPLFKLKNMLHNDSHFEEGTFQEYFTMIFNRFLLFSDHNQDISFKTRETIESESLKLSLNVMNKKWNEATSKMKSDFALVRKHSKFNHYFVIGEFGNHKINASTAEEFLCLHPDTFKVILEGRAVLKDIATKLSSDRVCDKVKQELRVTLFLADLSGKVVILKIRPIFYKIQNGLHGIYYELSHSRLLNMFEKKDACLFMSEISNSVKYACEFEYDEDPSNGSITNLCATPMTAESESNFSKLIRIPVKSADFSAIIFEKEDEDNLMNLLRVEFPNYLVEKSHIVRIEESKDIHLRFTVDLQTGIISMYSCQVTEVFGNPIYGCYIIRRNRAVKYQVISLTNFENINLINTNWDDSELELETSILAESRLESYLEITLKRWGLKSFKNDQIYISELWDHFQSFYSYGETTLIDGNIPVFLKIHSGRGIIYNADSVTHYTNERNHQSDCSISKNTIRIYKYFIEKRTVPYEIFGEISSPCENYFTDVTISELLTPLQTSAFSQTSHLNKNGKLLFVLYFIDGCIRGVNFMVNHLKLLHNDIAFRNVMVRKNSNKTSISNLIEKYCNFILTDDIVITDIKYCKYYEKIIREDIEDEMSCLATLFTEFVDFIFYEVFSNMIFDGDFKLVHLWIIQTIESLEKYNYSKENILSQFQDVSFQNIIQPLDEMVFALLNQKSNEKHVDPSL